MPNGLFYRVAVDSASGGWNAPCRTNGSFCYVPIPDANPSGRGTMFDRSYDEFSPFVTAMGDTWPSTLSGLCHLDPDFAHLTYGDQGSRAARLREFITPGSFIVFWAGLRWLDGPRAGSIVCSIIGFYLVSHVLRASDAGVLDAHRIAHSRHSGIPDDHVIVFADPRESGRLRRHIPIGEQRGRAQRVTIETLEAWARLCRKTPEPLKAGYI